MSFGAGLAAAAPASAQTACRGSAARVALNPALANPEPVVANPAGDPCVTADASPAGTVTLGPASLRDPFAVTRRSPGVAGAAAGVGAVTLTLGGTAITAEGVAVSQQVACVDGRVVGSGASRIGRLVVAGQAVPIAEGQAFDQTIGPIRIRANQESGGTRTALVLDVLGQQVVLGEARAGAASCADLGVGTPPGGGGGTPPGGGGAPGGGGSTDLSGICPDGATFDADRRLCVIRTGSGGSGGTIVVGRPFEGPQGGRVVPLPTARRLLGNRPCLQGRGPRFAILGTRRADRITGTNRGDRIFGLGGGDRLDGGRGNDCIEGNNGNDQLSGGQGLDRLYGLGGRDSLNGAANTDRLSGGTNRDTINAGFGADRVFGGSGNDAINVATAGPRASVSCGPGRDRVRANRVERRRLRACETRFFLPDKPRRG